MTDQEPTIDQELVLLKAHMLNFAEILYIAAKEGRISSYTPMTSIIWPVATIYTHLARGNALRGVDLVRQVRKDLGLGGWTRTPLEMQVYSVQPGDKPTTCEALTVFVKLLEPYLLRPRKTEVIQEPLW